MTQTEDGRRILEAGPEDADATLVLMHGLGADANDLAPVAEYLKLPDSLRLRVVLPDAPERPVTINGGMRMRAWYDIDPAAGLDSGRADIEASAGLARELIAREQARGIRAERIVVGGFSQGGVIALETGLSHGERLAGIIALSTYLHDAEHVAERVGLAIVDEPLECRTIRAGVPGFELRPLVHGRVADAERCRLPIPARRSAVYRGPPLHLLCLILDDKSGCCGANLEQRRDLALRVGHRDPVSRMRQRGDEGATHFKTDQETWSDDNSPEAPAAAS